MLDIDQTKAEAMIGKSVLVGISHCDKSGNISSHEQHFGTILRINSHEGLVICSAIDGQEVQLPPYLEQYSAADPGEYKLKSVGYTATDPDYISTWQVHPQVPEESDAP